MFDGCSGEFVRPSPIVDFGEAFAASGRLGDQDYRHAAVLAKPDRRSPLHQWFRPNAILWFSNMPRDWILLAGPINGFCNLYGSGTYRTPSGQIPDPAGLRWLDHDRTWFKRPAAGNARW
jgi:hypothetical protein